MGRVKTISSAETMFPRVIMAVGVIIMTNDGKVLIVQETRDKPAADRMAGDWTFPVETLEKGESLVEGVSRLIFEEVGDIKYGFSPKRDWIGDYNVNSLEKPVWGRVYLLHVEGMAEEFTGLRSVNDEVINHRWVLPRALRTYSRRKGVDEPLTDFLNGRREVICWQCGPAERWPE